MSTANELRTIAERYSDCLRPGEPVHSTPELESELPFFPQELKQLYSISDGIHFVSDNGKVDQRTRPFIYDVATLLKQRRWLQQEAESLRNEKSEDYYQWLPQFVVFADDFGGNYYAFKRDSDDAVYFIDRHDESPDDPEQISEHFSQWLRETAREWAADARADRKSAAKRSDQKLKEAFPLDW